MPTKPAAPSGVKPKTAVSRPVAGQTSKARPPDIAPIDRHHAQPIHASPTFAQRLDLLRDDPAGMAAEKEIQEALRLGRAVMGREVEAPVVQPFEVVVVPELKDAQGMILGSFACVAPQRTPRGERRLAAAMLQRAGFQVSR